MISLQSDNGETVVVGFSHRIRMLSIPEKRGKPGCGVGWILEFRIERGRNPKEIVHCDTSGSLINNSTV